MNIEGTYYYPGSQPFEDTAIDRKLFFGRDREKEELLQKVLARKLVVLYAKSGLGKTSLINAGVSQLLREKGCMPLKVRFNDSGTNPVQTVYNTIKEKVDQLRLDWEAGEKKTLWEYFKTAAFWAAGDSLMTPVLILDQFEEFFAFHEHGVRKDFILQLADLVNGTIPPQLRQAIRKGDAFPYGENPPDVKVLISIREDQLGLLEELSPEIPDILRNRYRLSALTHDQAREAITKPPQVRDEHIATTGFEYSDEALKAMLKYLSKVKEKSGEITKDEIESFQLQLLCRHIESNIRSKAAVGTGAGGFVVKKEDLGGEPGMQKVLQDFYEKQLTKLETPLMERRVRRLCESGLISASGRRLSLEEEEIERQFNVSPRLLVQLVDTRLLRAENRVGSVYYELSHDTLVTPIREFKGKHRTTNYKYILFVLISVLIVVVIVSLPRGGESQQQNEINKLFKEAQKFFLDSNYDEAMELYRKVLELEPNDVYAYIGIGNMLQRKGDYSGAIASYKKALALKPNYAEAHYNMGIVLRRIGDYEGAIASYKKALELKPDYAEAHNGMGNALSDEGDVKRAIASYKKALELKPDYAGFHYNMGNALYKKGDYKGAIASYKKALELKPDYAEAHNNIGTALDKIGDYEGAIASYKKAMQLKPDYAELHYNVGNTLKKKGDYEGAIASYKKTLALKPNDARAHYNIGVVLQKKGAYDAAIASYKKALELKPDYAFAHNNMGYALLKKGDYDAAIASYKKALEINPDYISAKTNLTELYLTTERFEKALQLANEVLKEKEASTSDVFAMKSIAISSLFLQGQHPGALKELKKLITYYRGLTKDYKRDWDYDPIKSFLTKTKRLNEQDKALLLTLIDLLESPKKEGDKKLKELEKRVRL